MGDADQERAQQWVAVRLPADRLGREPWAVWDTLTDLWVTAGASGEVDVYFDLHGARSCIRRLRYLASAGIRHT